VGDLIGRASMAAIFGSEDKRAARAQAVKEIPFAQNKDLRMGGVGKHKGLIDARVKELLEVKRKERLEALGMEAQGMFGGKMKLPQFLRHMSKTRGGAGLPPVAQPTPAAATVVTPDAVPHATSPGQAKQGAALIAKRIIGTMVGLLKINKAAFGAVAEPHVKAAKKALGIGRTPEEIMDAKRESFRARHAITGMGKGGSKTLGGGFTKLGALTRLEDGTGIKDAIKASRTVTKGELGTANNPMTVKLNEEPV